MKTKLLLLTAFAAGSLSAQTQAVLGEEAVKVSGNVWAIMGFPNIGIVVGTRATLVVDTDLGPASGATIARVVAKDGQPVNYRVGLFVRVPDRIDTRTG